MSFTSNVTFQNIDFVANFGNEHDKAAADATLENFLYHEGLCDHFGWGYNGVDWSQEVGEQVPLRIVRIANHPKYAAVIRFEDDAYMNHYNDTLELVNGTSVKWSNKRGGWVIRPEDFMEAWDTIEYLNEVIIPMEDTVEWEAYHDQANERILFYPYNLGEPNAGDHWAGIGEWDDLTRSFVFSETDWDFYMTFYGYSAHT